MALIPSERLTNWIPGTDVGVPGGIEQYLAGGIHDRAVTGTVINVTSAPYNADPTGSSDCSAAFAAAWTDAVSGDVIYLPSGTYLLDSAWSIASYYKPNISIRGDPSVGHVWPSKIKMGAGASGGVAISIGVVGESDGQYITGSPVKGSTVLSVSSASAYSTGDLAKIYYTNETDNTRIQAGSSPVFPLTWTFPVRRQMVRVSAVNTVGANTITVSPSLVVDTYGTPSIARLYLPTNGLGFESIEIDCEDMVTSYGLHMQAGVRSWLYDVHIVNVSSRAAELFECYQSEMRKCFFEGPGGLTANLGGLFCWTCGSCLIEDNIIDNFHPDIEVNDATSSCVFAFNLTEAEDVTSFFSIDTNHGTHNSYNLYEGNMVSFFESDGFFGTESEPTFFRNWCSGSNLNNSTASASGGLNLKRLARNASAAGNVFGKTGQVPGFLNSLGLPNIGNGSSEGTSEMSAGDFPVDWKMTATLTTRTNGTDGVFTLVSGSMREGQAQAQAWIGDPFDGSSTGRVLQSVSILTGGSIVNGVMTCYAGGTFSFTSITSPGSTATALPALNTVMSIYPGPSGFQEQDLDVENTTIDKGNYSYGSGGSPGSMSPLGGDTLPDSLFRSEKPDWFGSLSWPAFDPQSPDSSSYSSIPAAYRFTHGGDDPPSGSGVAFTGSGSTTFTGSGSVTFA